MASQSYLNGDFYVATESVAAGESPSVAPTKWRKLEIPANFERYVVAAAAATCEPHRGQHEKGALLSRAAADILDETLIDEARTHGQGHQPVVFTR